MARLARGHGAPWNINGHAVSFSTDLVGITIRVERAFRLRLRLRLRVWNNNILALSFNTILTFSTEDVEAIINTLSLITFTNQAINSVA